MNDLIRQATVLRDDDTVDQALQLLLQSDLPALPVIDAHGLYAGIFGEREFIAALFPGYLGELSYAGFVPATLDDALEKRAACRHESVRDHMNTDHVDVSPGFSTAQLAETFLHHRVLILPVADAGRVQGVIVRSDFFRRLARRFLDRG